MEILAIIPARGGSKGIPNKNMTLLCDRPLIQYTIDAALSSSLITRTILSSDNDNIIEYCRRSKIDVPFKRPEQLANDLSPMIDVIKHSVQFLKDSENYKPDYIILLQPTSPFRTGKHIDEALQKLVNSDADSIVSVVAVPHNCNPYSIMSLKDIYLVPYLDFDEKNNLRQLKPRFYARNGAAIYAFSYDCIMKKHSIYGDKILPYFMEKIDSIDIDDKMDLIIAEALMKQR